MITVACVLRSGGEYGQCHAQMLKAMVARHLQVDHRFVCLTDIVAEVQAAGMDALELPHPWPGWWSKIALFAPGLLPPPVLYFDLDVLLVGPLDDLVSDHQFTMLRSFWPNMFVNSSIMAWNINMSAVYESFARDPERYAELYRAHGRWGDQDWILHRSPVPPQLWQDRFPGRFFSYKLQVKSKGLSPTASAVVYHGRPRPWATQLGREVYATYR